MPPDHDRPTGPPDGPLSDGPAAVPSEPSAGAGRSWRHQVVLWLALAVAVMAVASVTVALGMPPATAEAGTGLLRLAHLSPATGPMDLYLTGSDGPPTLVAPAVAYRTAGPYLARPAGTYTISARPAGARPDSSPAVEASVEVPGGSAQTAAVVDAPGGGHPVLQVLDDQTAPAAPGTAQVRVVQGATGVLDADLTGGPSLARGLTYGSTSPYATVPARAWEVDLRSRPGPTQSTTVPLADTAVTTLLVTREPDGRLAVEAVPDAATVAAAPGGEAPGAETPRVPHGGTEAGLGGTAFSMALVSLGSWWDDLFSSAPDAPPAPNMPLATATAPHPDGLRPTGMSIPSIGLAALNVVDLRIDYRGALQVPTDFGKIGWYTSGAVPGEPGPAVFVGHVDTRHGPAVFARLDHLRAGDVIEVPRSDGATARYGVDAVEHFPKDTVPTDRIYGPSTTPQLRLLTCGGPFDEGTLSYQDNVVVFASAR